MSSTTPTAASRVEAGSFRDPESRIFYTGQGVFRALSGAGLADWEAFAGSGLYEKFAADGKIVGTKRLETTDVPATLGGNWDAVLEHDLIPFISYPYEWSFGMLKDAALLQLDLLDQALKQDQILKDSSPYNVQFKGAQPVFIDVGSFERLRAGEPWIGYRQFCMLFLNPLMLRAYKDVPFQPWLRGAIDGITPVELAPLMSFRDRFRKGVTAHVKLHASLEKRYADRTSDTKSEVKKAGFRKELIQANVNKLRKIVTKLTWEPDAGAVWVEYGAVNTYRGTEQDEKAKFVEESAATQHWGRTWDLGCNDGRFSQIAAKHSDQVIAVDGDEGVIEVLYRKLHEDGRTDILPIVMSLTDPSPDRGWRGKERRTLEERGKPDLTLILALIHHIVITGNVPVTEYLDWLRSLDSALVIEFPTTDDPMVKRLFQAKREGLHTDYTREHFEACLKERFDIERSQELSGGTRVMYFARPRG